MSTLFCFSDSPALCGLFLFVHIKHCQLHKLAGNQNLLMLLVTHSSELADAQYGKASTASALNPGQTAFLIFTQRITAMCFRKFRRCNTMVKVTAFQMMSQGTAIQRPERDFLGRMALDELVIGTVQLKQKTVDASHQTPHNRFLCC